MVEVYRDDGISGAKGRDQRLCLDAMLKDAGRRKFDIVMAWTIDRLGPDATTQIRLTSTKLEILQRRTVLSRAQKLIASFASAFVRLPAGITKADVGVTASEASPNVSEIAAFGCEAAITRSSAGSAS